MSSSEFTGKVTRVTEGGTKEQAIAKLNQPLSDIEGCLNTLASRIADMTNKATLIRKYTPLASTITPGSLVYYNTTTQRFEKAIAALLDTPGEQGESVEAESSRVEGLVLSIDSETSGNTNVFGTVLLGGFWEEEDTSLPVTKAVLGSQNPEIGTYYLSPTTAGTATKDPGSHLRQPIITYHGGGKLNFSIHCMAHDNHFHASTLIGSTWVSVEDELPEGVEEAPEDAQWWYNGTDASFTDLGELSDHAAVFCDGILQYSGGNYIVQYGYLWCKLDAYPVAGRLMVFNHYPFAYGSPVTRSVESTNDALTVNTRNGVVSLTQNDFTDGSIVYRPRAITGIAGKTLSFTHVVSGIGAGPGIYINSNSDGTCIVSSASVVNSLQDAYSINYNGAAPVSDGTFLYITFPAGRSASIVFNLPVNGVDSGTTVKATVWGQCVGTCSKSFSVTGWWFPSPSATTSTTFNTQGTDLGSMSFIGATGKLSYAESGNSLEFSGSGSLVAKLALDNSGSTANTDIRLLRVGFKLAVVDVDLSESAEVTPYSSINAIVNTMYAGTAITKFQCLRVVGGTLYPCSAAAGQVTQANSFVGIALSDAAAGEALDFVSAGMVLNAVSGMTPGSSIYVGKTSGITDTPPLTDGGSYNKRIGIALTATDIQVSIDPAVTQ